MKIQKNERIFNVIKKIGSDTGILDGITFEDTKESKPEQQNFTLGNTALPNTLYGNTVVFHTATQVHPLQDLIIYNSGASGYICNNLSMMTDIRDAPLNDTLSTASGNLQITKYSTITLQNTIHNQSKVLHLPNAAYIPDSAVSLASVQKLKNFGVRWNQDNNTLTFNGNTICQLEQHYGVYTLYYKAMTMPLPSVFASFRDNPKTTETTTSTLHRRLGHAGPQALKHIPTNHGVTIKESGPATEKCETYGLSKMHQLLSKRPAHRATRPFERLHFDLIIPDVAFDATKVLGHFYNKYTRRNYPYPLANKKQTTLITMFKHIIFMAERRYGLAIKALVIAIRTDQDPSIGKALQDFVQSIGIDFEWSSVYTPEQNGAAERSGGVITTKARYIRVDAELPEDLWPEVYLAAYYLSD